MSEIVEALREPEGPPPRRDLTTRFKLPDGTKITLPLPQLSPSSASMYAKCPRMFWFRYVAGMKEPPGVALVLGTSGHAAMEENNHHKRKRGVDLSKKKVVEVFRDDWATRSKEIEMAQWHAAGTDRDRVAKGVTPSIEVYMDRVAPRIVAKKVEHRFTFSALGVPVQGYIDLLTDDDRVFDYKFAGRSSPYLRPGAADKSFQLTTYAIGMQTDKVGYLILNRDRPEAVRRPSTREHAQKMDVKREYVQIARGISAGAFPKCPDGSWFCSPKWCGFYYLCVGARPGKSRHP